MDECISLLILIKMSATILNNTDMMFLLSDYIDDKTAVNLFNSQRSYRGMIERFPNRYTKKKQIVLAKLEEELEKWNAHIWLMSSQKTTLFLTVDMGEWRENCVVNMEDGKVRIAIDEGMLAWCEEVAYRPGNCGYEKALESFMSRLL